VSAVEQYLALDIPGCMYSSPSLHWDGLTMPLATDSVDCAIATEVLEHCPTPLSVLDEVHRVLRPGGVFFFTVPFLWPLHDVPNDEFRFTPFALRRLLGKAGFSEIELGALGGWDASLAQMVGLWVRRSPMSSRKRAILSMIALPIVRCLLRRDRPPAQFEESSMITGLWGAATKPAM
jgi:SAM-dependent methyltransferase